MLKQEHWMKIIQESHLVVRALCNGWGSELGTAACIACDSVLQQETQEEYQWHHDITHSIEDNRSLRVSEPKKKTVLIFLLNSLNCTTSMEVINTNINVKFYFVISYLFKSTQLSIPHKLNSKKIIQVIQTL